MMIVIHNKKTYNGEGYYIGRPSILGNPASHYSNTTATVIVGSRKAAIDYFRKYFEESVANNNNPIRHEIYRLANIYVETDRLDLICWCKPKQCHGDIIANKIIDIRNTLRWTRSLQNE